MLPTWIYTAAEGQIAAIVTFSELPPGLIAVHVEGALRRLEAQGHIQLLWLDPAPALPRAQLTASGVAYAENDNERWNNQVFRDRAARNALLAWLHDQRDQPQGASLIINFFRDPRSIVAGHFSSAADVDAAAAYLQDKELIKGIGSEDHQHGPTWARLTAKGTDCIEQGGDVADYLTPRTTGTTYNFHAPVTGNNVAIGDNATQYTAINSTDAESIRILIEAVTQALPALALGTSNQQEAENAATQALTEIKELNPSHPRIQAALKKIGTVLAGAGNQALSAVLRAGIDYEMGKLGLPPGS